MKNFKRNRLSVIFTAVLLVTVAVLLSCCNDTADVRKQAYSGDIYIDSDNFPDIVFRNWLLSPQNLNGAGADGILTPDEIQGVTQIYIDRNNGDAITDLGGIEYFVNLEELAVKDNGLVSLDLRQNTKLQYVNCMYNRLQNLYVSGLAHLETLFCEYNYLKELDLSGDSALKTLYCRHNLLSNLDLSDNTELVFIETFDNLLETIDVSMLSKLEFLHIDHNKLTALDMSRNTALKGGGFVVRNNDIRELRLPVIEDFTVYYDDFAEQNPIDGYEQLKWYADADFNVEITSDVLAEGQTLYGKRIPNAYTVRFDGNGALGVPSSVSAVYNENFSLPQDEPVRRGYIFKGWAKEKTGASLLYQPSESVSNLGGKKYNGEKVTLYAQWSPVTYKIIFDGAGGNGEMPEMTVKYGQTIALEGNKFVKSGYDFAGWATVADGYSVYGDGQTVSDLSYNDGDVVTLYAVWERDAQSVRQPYEQQLRQTYDRIDKGNYFAEDAESIDSRFGYWSQKLVDAGKSETLMKQAVSNAETDFSQVPTRRMRVDEAVTSWENKHATALEKLNYKPIDAKDAVNVVSLLNRASEELNTDKLKDYSSLTDEASLSEVARLAKERLQHTETLLNEVIPVAIWTADAYPFSKTPLSQVTSDKQSQYVSLTDRFDGFTNLQKQYAEGRFLESLTERLELSNIKKEYVEQLENLFKNYDSSQYHPDQWEKLTGIFSAGVSAVEGASDTDAVRLIVERSADEMNGVSGQPPLDPEPQPPSEEETDLIKERAVAWLVTLGVLTAVAVLYVVFKNRKK